MWLLRYHTTIRNMKNYYVPLTILMFAGPRETHGIGTYSVIDFQWTNPFNFYTNIKTSHYKIFIFIFKQIKTSSKYERNIST